MQEWIESLDYRLWGEQLLEWADTQLFVGETLIQIALLFATLMMAMLVAKRLTPLFSSLLQKIRFLSDSTYEITKRKLAMPISWLFFQLITIVVLEQFGVDNRLLIIVMNLTVTWVAIRFFSSFVKNPVFSTIIAVTGWTIAALNILDWLDPTVVFLDEIAFTAGDLKISLLMIIKGLITLGFLLWAAISFSNVSERYIRNVGGLTPSLQVLLIKLIKIALITFVILIGISSVGIDITALAVFSGAVGVGIGFGLQKIVSNFISGIILLIDRSIKPGDVIELDDTYGWINKLSGRHVSVITRDGKEHLIPNEDLITQRVINWSYSSKAVRIKIPVGISYNADPHQARKLMLQAIKDVDRVLDNPIAACLITGFGDNSVDLELRVWIEDPSNGVSNIISEIYFKVWDIFKENNIGIPFPQRDVHLNFSDDALVDAIKKLKTT